MTRAEHLSLLAGTILSGYIGRTGQMQSINFPMLVKNAVTQAKTVIEETRRQIHAEDEERSPTPPKPSRGRQ